MRASVVNMWMLVFYAIILFLSISNDYPLIIKCSGFIPWAFSVVIVWVEYFNKGDNDGL